MSAQIQLIMTATVLSPLKKSVLRQLNNLVQGNKLKSWFVIYLCTFIILHSCALLTSHEHARAKKQGLLVRTSSGAFPKSNKLQSRYITDSVVEELHNGANIMLAYFHYCNKGNQPLASDFLTSERNVVLLELDAEQLEFVRMSDEQVKARSMRS